MQKQPAYNVNAPAQGYNAPSQGYNTTGTYPSSYQGREEYQCKKQPTTAGTVCLFILCFFLPPLPVAIRTGCSADFCINIVLTILLWLPGVIHAMYVVIKTGRHNTLRQREMGAAAAGGASHPYGYKDTTYPATTQYGTAPRTY